MGCNVKRGGARSDERRLKYDISAIDILLRHWKSRNGYLMVKVAGLHGIGDDRSRA